MRDLTTEVDVKASVAPAAHTASVNGSSVDLQDYDSAVVAFVPGTITDGTHTPKVQDSPDGTTWTDVAAADLQGTLAVLASNAPQKVGYVGNQRYVRAVVTVAGATTGGVYGAVVLAGDRYLQPSA